MWVVAFNSRIHVFKILEDILFIQSPGGHPYAD